MDHVYLDYAATTPVREEVRSVMSPFVTEDFGNPSSIHRWGRKAKDALEAAREELAGAIGAEPSEITFVRGGTESDNAALLGWAQAWAARGETPTVAISAIEHHAVLAATEHLQALGSAHVVRIGVRADGTVDLVALRNALEARPTLVSVMWVNNESGIVLPITEIGEIVHEAGGTFHSDAAQALGKVPIDVAGARVDMLSATGHKIYGPKGTGFLFARQKTALAPLLYGGGQEHGLRPGTEDVAGSVGLARAVSLAVEEQEAFGLRLRELRTRLESGLCARLADVRINAGEACRAPHVLSLGVGGVEDGAALVMALDLEGVAVSGGSACASGAAKASHVTVALYGAADPYAPLRYSLGRDTTEADVDRAVQATAEVVKRMRET